MSLYQIKDNPMRQEEFPALYSFEDGKFSFRCADPEDDIYWFDSECGLPIPVATFMEGGVHVPFSDLFIQFLLYYNLVPTQLGLNSIKIVSSIYAFNQILGTAVGVKEIFHHYKLSCSKNKLDYYLSVKPKKEPFVTHIPDSNPGAHDHVIFVYEPVDGTLPRDNTIIPRNHSSSYKP